MANIHKINENDAKKFLDLVSTVDEEAAFLLFDKKERKREEEAVRFYIKKLNNNPKSLLLVSENENAEFTGYIAGEQPHLQRLQHTLNINIAIRASYSQKMLGTHLSTALLEHAKLQDIHRLEASIIADNTASLRLAKKFGLEIEGIKRDAIKINSKYHDLYLLGMLL